MHRLIRPILLCLTLSVFVSVTASAGPNAGGTLVISVSEGLIYSADTDYCGLAEATSCANVDSEAPAGSTMVAHVMAAFPGSSRLAGASFGLSYDTEQLSILDSGNCSDLELPDPESGQAGSGSSRSVQLPESRIESCSVS